MVSSEVELKELKRNFEQMDTDGDGVLSYQELLTGLKLCGYEDPKEIDTIFKGMDMDQNGSVEYTEFLAAMINHNQ